MIAIADNLDEDPLSRRVRVETRRWAITAVSPGRYGGKPVNSATIIDMGGSSVSLADLSDEELVALEGLASARLQAMPPTADGAMPIAGVGDDERAGQKTGRGYAGSG